MHIAWGSLLLVAVVSIVAGVAVVTLVSLAMVGLSARSAAQIDGAPEPAERPALTRAAGTALAAACLAAAAGIVGYGLFMIIS